MSVVLFMILVGVRTGWGFFCTDYILVDSIREYAIETTAKLQIETAQLPETQSLNILLQQLWSRMILPQSSE